MNLLRISITYLKIVKMGAKETLLHTIKVNRRLRKLEESQKPIHPALKSNWELLTRDQQSDALFKWKISIKK